MTTEIPTQQLRDTMAQNDHDAITGITVLVETVLSKITSIEDQMKDMKISQAANLAAMDGRVKSMEEDFVKLKPIPSVSHESLVKQVGVLFQKIDDLDETRSQALGGWKMFMIIIGIIGFINSTLLMLHALGIIK